jgi:hypothetical protein
MSAVSRYGIILVVIALFGIVLITSRWNSAAKTSDPSRFEGCYAGPGISVLRLAPSGQLLNGGERVGSYRIVAPVGGKHGYLVEATGLNIRRLSSGVVMTPGDGGFLWPIAPSGMLKITFAPDGEYELHRQPACS